MMIAGWVRHESSVVGLTVVQDGLFNHLPNIDLVAFENGIQGNCSLISHSCEMFGGQKI